MTVDILVRGVSSRFVLVWLFALAMVGGFLFVGPSKAEDPQPSIDELVKNMLKADTSEERARRCSKVFQAAKEDDLQRLVMHPDVGVALSAGWERVRRTVPVMPADGGLVTPNAEALNRFLGLVEGRTRAPLPEVWEKTVRAASSLGGPVVRFPHPPIRRQRTGLWSSGNLPDPAPPNFKREGKRWIVQAEGREWSLPILPDAGFGVGQVAVGLNEKMVFFLIYDWALAPHALYAVDRDSGEVKWSSLVWAASGLIAYSGFGTAEAELRLREEEVIVFGTSGYAFVGGFDTKDGRALYRFSTDFFDKPGF